MGRNTGNTSSASPHVPPVSLYVGLSFLMTPHLPLRALRALRALHALRALLGVGWCRYVGVRAKRKLDAIEEQENQRRVSMELDLAKLEEIEDSEPLDVSALEGRTDPVVRLSSFFAGEGGGSWGAGS